MSNENLKNPYTKEDIKSCILSAIQEIAPSQFSGTISDDVSLGADLGLKSLDFVRLVSALQQRYSHKLLPFQNMFISADGTFQQDIKISDLVGFLYAHLND